MEALSSFAKPTIISSGCVVGFSNPGTSRSGGGLLGAPKSCLGSNQQLRALKTWGVASPLPVVATRTPHCVLWKTGGSIPVKETNEEEEGRMRTLVSEIKEKFRRMGDGETSPSAYDTAWVARIPSAGDPTTPHFSDCLDWILNNQLEDGSWGEPSYYLLYDRLVNTLACVLALKTWNTGNHQIAKGVEYLRDNMKFVADKSTTGLITCGFELAFPWMLKEAECYGMELPYDLPCMQEIARRRANKIKRIPPQVMHSAHTTLLYTLEAQQEVVQWDRILKLQSRDGSFLSSPSATAIVYMNTGDGKCLEFLTKTVDRFGGCVPCQYPIDLFERIWAIDTVRRLGIHHHFQAEISNALDYLYRYLRKDGMSWGRDNPIADVDDTCMALRLLRLHGYPVSPDVLENFKDDEGNFVCFPGQTHQGVSDMFNLYRFTQIAFPGEKILAEAKDFVVKYLTNCIKNNEVNDKWSLKKSLDKEVKHALTVPWRISLERLEAREYIDHYGDYDVWIAKTVYWLYSANDPRYLELAKLDYNRLQNLYKEEIESILKWRNGSGFAGPLATETGLRETHFAIAATLYEPEFSAARIAYTKCNCVEDALRDLVEHHERVADLEVVCQAVEKWNPSIVQSLPPIVKDTFMGMYYTQSKVVAEASKAQGKDMFPYFHDLSVKQIQYYLRKRQHKGTRHVTSFQDYIVHQTQDLAVAIRTLPAMLLMGEYVNNYALKCLDHTSTIQDDLSSFLSLFVAIQRHKNLHKEVTSSTVVSLCMKEWCCSEQEAIGHLEAMMEEKLQELLHGCLKPSRVPRHCRRMLLEHARIVQYFHRGELLGGAEPRREMVKSDMDRLFTAINLTYSDELFLFEKTAQTLNN